MGRTGVTSADVAALAGVSRSAVSRVFTEGGSASPATAAKVRQAAAELGYRPNPLARAMITGKSRIIGLLVAYLDNQFYPLAIQRLSAALEARGYHILLFMVDNTRTDLDRIVQELLDYRVDGIVTASVDLSSKVTRAARAAGIPVVMFNRGQEGEGITSVTSANIAGGRQVAEFLHAGAHERIAHIAGWQGSSTGRDRARGFCEHLEAHGVSPVAVIDGMYDRDTAIRATREIVEAHAPDAIFVGNDHMAFAVMDCLRHELGLDVPGEVSVVGYDDVPLAAWPSYDLTTVRQPLGRMVEATVETLLGQIETPDRPPERIEIEAPLMIRGSARLPKDGP